jgi:CubicO group peptidase (beta-lactamase class C family)
LKNILFLAFVVGCTELTGRPDKPTQSDHTHASELPELDDTTDEPVTDESVTEDTAEPYDTGMAEPETATPVVETPPYDDCTDGKWPVPDWEVGSPADHGMSAERLEEAAMFAGAEQSQCMLVAKDGVIVGEWYWGISADTKVKNWSVAKSYAATVVGAAIDDGYLDGLESPIADYVEEWQGTDKEAVNIHHMLSMSSGLRFGLFRDNVMMALAGNMTRRALNNPLTHTPGDLWEYNNHTVQVAEPLLRAATGMNPQDYATERLWEPMGMDVNWEEDRQGHAAMYMNAKASCRDQLKFGYMYLRQGCWNGEQLVSREFIEAATSPSTEMNQGYGYWWWLNGGTPTLDSVTFEPHPEGMLHPQAPEDNFCAVGLGNQFIEVMPSHDMVVVRVGFAPQENMTLWATEGAVLEALLEDGEQHVHNHLLEMVLDAVE